MSNVAIKINGEFIDIDDSSAIGFTFQSYNPAEPENLFLSYTNTFSVPLTKKNKKIFQFSDNVYYNGKEVYEKFSVAVYIGASLLFSGRLFVDSIEDDRINLSIVDKLDFVEALKAIPFGVDNDEDNDEEDCLQKMIVESVNDDIEDTVKGFSQLVQYLQSGTNALWLPYSVGTTNEVFLKPATGDTTRSTAETREISGYSKNNNIWWTQKVTNNYGNDGATFSNSLGTVNSFDNVNNVNLFTSLANSMRDLIDNQHTGIKTCHIFGKVSTLLQLCFNKIGVESNLGNFVTNQYIRLCDIVPMWKGLTEDESQYQVSRWQFFYEWKKSVYSLGASSNEYMNNLTAWDLVKMIMQEYNLVVDVSWNVTTQKYTYTFVPFKYIQQYNLETFKLQSIVSKSFSIDSIKQQCVISYEGLGNDEDTDTDAGLLIECKNKNIEEGSDEDSLFTISRYIPSYYAETTDDELVNYMQLDLSSSDTAQQLIMITPDYNQYASTNVWCDMRWLNMNKMANSWSNTYKWRGSTIWSITAFYNSYVPCVTNVPLLVAKQTTVKVNGAYEQYQSMVEYPLVYKIKVNANVYKAISHKSNHYCKIEGLVGLYYISSIENFNPATDDYFTMTIYRLQRDEIDGEEQVFYLATEHKTFVNTEDNNYITLE